jgi:hypothetical protein
MNKIIKYFLGLFFLLIISFTGCEKYVPKEIIGRWKLTEAQIITNDQYLEIINYSENDIIYDFRENGQLFVTGAIPELFIFDDFQEGKHYFKYEIHDDCPSCDIDHLLIVQQRLGGAKKRYACPIDTWFSNGEKMHIVVEKSIKGDEYKAVKYFVKLK